MQATTTEDLIKKKVIHCITIPFRSICSCTRKSDIEMEREFVYRRENIDPYSAPPAENQHTPLSASVSMPTRAVLAGDSEQTKRIVRELIKGIAVNISPVQVKSLRKAESMCVPEQTHFDWKRSGRIKVGDRLLVQKTHAINKDFFDVYNYVAEYLCPENKELGNRMFARIMPLLNQSQAANCVKRLFEYSNQIGKESLPSSQGSGGLIFDIYWETPKKLAINMEQTLVLLNPINPAGPTNGYCTVNVRIEILKDEIMAILDQKVFDQKDVDEILPSLVAIDTYSKIRNRP